MRKAIAIDFDGCLCENAWPEIGAPNWTVIHAAQLAQREGAALILWTCRNGDLLTSAVEWCRERGLIFDTINENLPERLEHYGSESRKVSADEYWDDRAVHMPSPPNDPLTLEELREMDGEPVWVVELNGYPPHWGLVYWCRKNKRNVVYVTINNGASICSETFMAAGGKIYRRKPEEGMT